MDRVLVTIGLGVDAARVADELRTLGAKRAAEPAPELPGVLVCEVPSVHVRRFLEDAAAVPGVQVAELDALRSTEPDLAGPGRHADEPGAPEVRRRSAGDSQAPPRPPTSGPTIMDAAEG